MTKAWRRYGIPIFDGIYDEITLLLTLEAPKPHTMHFSLVRTSRLPLAPTRRLSLARLFPLCALFVFSCKGPAAHNDVQDTTHAAIAAPSGREALIRALIEMRGRLASHDKNQIARIFVFPEPDSVINHYSFDSTVGADWSKDSAFTERLYNSRFDSISKELDIPGFAETMTKLDLTKLLHNDHIFDSLEIKTDPCDREFMIDIEHDSLVSITHGSNVNVNYEPKKGEAAAPDDTEGGDPCLYRIHWDFVWDGRKLRLVRQSAAG